MYKPGELHHATVGGRAAIVYLTMDAVEMVDDDLIPRFRLGPKESVPHMLIPSEETLVIGERVQPFVPMPEGIMKKDLPLTHEVPE